MLISRLQRRLSANTRWAAHRDDRRPGFQWRLGMAPAVDRWRSVLPLGLDPSGECQSACAVDGAPGVTGAARRRSSGARWRGWLACLPAALTLNACGYLSIPQRNQLGAAAVASVAGVMPSADIEQTYYLGSFDPRDQLPPTIYRIRVRGQSSALNQTKFASGWVPAEVVDSLGRTVGFEAGKPTANAADPLLGSSLSDQGRGLVLFGPEGFREAPRGHRLVVMMGSSPEMVEQAFATALGTVARAQYGGSNAALQRDAFTLLLELDHERDRLDALSKGD